MTREEQLETLLSDLAIQARNFLGQPRNAIARAELRRACDRQAAFMKLEAAERELLANAPQAEDPRPAPRLPYRDD